MTPAQFDLFLQVARHHGVQEFSLGGARVVLYPMIPRTEPRPDETFDGHHDRVLFHSAK